MTPTDIAVDPVAPPRGIDLPCEDGIPLESPWHRAAMDVLDDSLAHHRRGRHDYYAGGNMFVYFSPEMVKTYDFRGPDFYVVNGVDGRPYRRSWVAWEEGGRLPDVIVEITSDSTRRIDQVDKLELYSRRLAIPEYFLADPDTRTVVGWRRYNGTVEAIEDEGGKLWSAQLETYIGGQWEGTNDRHCIRSPMWFPRLFDERGRLIPTLTEAAVAEAERAKQKAAREKENAEREKENAEREKQNAEREKQNAEREKQNAEREKQNAVAQSRRAETAEAESARLRAEIDALRGQTPPTA